MNRLSLVLGSSTRSNLVEALSMSSRPLTAYRVARSYNMNVAKVYVEARRLAGLGLLEAVKGKRGTEYRLEDEDLRRLALKLSDRVTPYDAWSSEKAKQARFRSGLSTVPGMTLGGRAKVRTAEPSRLPGELENLASLAKKKFDAKYRRRSDRRYDRL
ncbi:MAG: hypothetical protein ACLP9K_00690 [Nitrososphaerales archaeon]